MESDLRTLSVMNKLCKYADDTSLIVPSDTDVCVLEEMSNVKNWADKNKMIINFKKTTEIVFRRPNPRLCIDVTPLDLIKQVENVKLLGVIIDNKLCFNEHVLSMLKLCNQRMYLLKLLRGQGLPSKHLNTIFHGLVLSKISYAISCWGGFVNAQLISKINSMLSRCFKYGYCKQVYKFEDLLHKADSKLFHSMQSTTHCIHALLPNQRPLATLRMQGHPYELPRYNYETFRKSFLPRCLFNFFKQ